VSATLTRRHRFTLGTLVTCGLVFASYSNVLTAPFVYDDQSAIADNLSIRAILPLSTSFWAPQDTPTAGRPIVNLSFALNYWFGQQDVYGYHLVNIAIHILNTLLLAHWLSLALATVLRAANSVLQRYSPAIAWIVSSLWALHPMQTESVSYVTQRTEVLMATFLLGMLYAAHRAWVANAKLERYAWQAVSMAACSFGMACKEVMVVAPVLLVFYDLSIHQVPVTKLLRARLFFYGGVFATWGILIGLLSTNPRGQSVGVLAGFTPWLYFTTQCWAIVHYLFLVIWPFGLCADYGVMSVSDVATWGPPCAVLIALAALTLWTWTRDRGLAMLGIWFFVILSPTSSFVPIITEPIAERRMYLPLVSPILLAVIASIAFAERLETWANRSIRKPGVLSGILLLAAGLCLLLGYGAATYDRNRVYSSEFAFWNDVATKRPLNFRALSSIGLWHLNEGNHTEAHNAFRSALAIAPRYLDANINIAALYLKEKRFTEARQHIDLALDIDPKNGYALSTLGSWYLDQKEYGMALTFLDAARKRIPNHPLTIYNRAVVLAELGRMDEADEEYKQVLVVAPHMANAYNNLGHIELVRGNLDQAEAYIRQALSIDTNFALANVNLGTIFAQREQFAIASEHFEKAIEIDPNLVDAHYNLGICYAELEKFDEAIREYRRCIELNASDLGAWINLGLVYRRQGKSLEARECFVEALRLNPNSDEARSALQSLE
jgi:protein O-mannosyl-transferase